MDSLKPLKIMLFLGVEKEWINCSGGEISRHYNPNFPTLEIKKKKSQFKYNFPLFCLLFRAVVKMSGYTYLNIVDYYVSQKNWSSFWGSKIGSKITGKNSREK